MTDPISHLPGIEAAQVRSKRLSTQVLAAGPNAGEPVLFLHGNLSAATFWEETMLALPNKFRAVAPDQRGFGLSDRSALIDASRGYSDWTADAVALADFFGWQRFHLVGHSLGGCVGWSLLGCHADRLLSVTLVAPGPPGGFPGAHGERGELNHADGAGSGAGLTNPRFIERLKSGERDTSDPFFSPRAVMNRAFWKPPFRPAREEELLTAMLQVHLGDKQFPGDWTVSTHWPGFAPGRFGPINALAPRNNQDLLEKLAATPHTPRLLWICGSEDAIVSDHSLSDPGQQGLLGLRPDWPGECVFPPQPILTQVKFALDQYERHGGDVKREILAETGHTPYLERPEVFRSLLHEHLNQA
jgi:pimeloyl-ACP methyl ester carboxylesterase